jgi:hypothetical protein
MTDLNTEAASDTAALDLPFVVVPASDMYLHFTGLLKSAEGTDVMFEVSGETIPVHRCVLSARSPVFRAQLFGPMKEGTTAGVIHIDTLTTWKRNCESVQAIAEFHLQRLDARH